MPRVVLGADVLYKATFTHALNVSYSPCSGDPLSNMLLDFQTKEDALEFAKKNGVYVCVRVSVCVRITTVPWLCTVCAGVEFFREFAPCSLFGFSSMHHTCMAVHGHVALY